MYFHPIPDTFVVNTGWWNKLWTGIKAMGRMGSTSLFRPISPFLPFLFKAYSVTPYLFHTLTEQGETFRIVPPLHLLSPWWKLLQKPLHSLLQEMSAESLRCTIHKSNDCRLQESHQVARSLLDTKSVRGGIMSWNDVTLSFVVGTIVHQQTSDLILGTSSTVNFGIPLDIW